MQDHKNHFEENGFENPLRPSLFNGVPPFINYVPNQIFSDLKEKPPQYWDFNKKWDQEQFWRFVVAMQNWIMDCAAVEDLEKIDNGERKIFPDGMSQFNSKEWQSAGMNHRYQSLRKSSRRSREFMTIRPPFEECASDAASFLKMHPGVSLTQFPKLHQICRKNFLGKNYALMRRKFPQDYNFHPLTYTLPQDIKKLSKMMMILEEKARKLRCNETVLWIVKPPNKSKGTGIKVITNSIESIPNYPTCIQRYVINPLLIDGFKFDIRLYVLITSLEPLRLYLYDDGLVRIATEKYTENAKSISDSCIHVCNYAINCRNTENFKFNNNPSGYEGNKWRFRCFWKYLAENSFITYDQMEMLWEDMKDVVIKTLLISRKETCEDFAETSPTSMYNCYKLLGFDILIDKNLKVHLMEVNSRPELKDDVIDKTVNRPMLHEMIRIIGFHIPKSCESHRHFIQRKFKLSEKNKNGCDYPFTYQPRQYAKKLNQEDRDKQMKYSEQQVDRNLYLQNILEQLTPADVRFLVKMEEEKSVTKGFECIFPTNETYKYFKLFGDRLPYFDMLYDAYENAYACNRKEGIQKLQKYCENGFLK